MVRRMVPVVRAVQLRIRLPTGPPLEVKFPSYRRRGPFWLKILSHPEDCHIR
jgi:hypothetical protein